MKANKTLKSIALTMAALCSANASAQDVNRELYRDYTPRPKYILPAPAQKTRTGETRPDHVDNSQTVHFPPVFNQEGGSCGSASNEAYALTYELNALRNLDGSKPQNQLPSHFVYLLAYQNSEREEIAQKNGIPNVVDYGGRTYSQTFGYQDCDWEDSGRMQGYDKWYRAMFNRVVKSASFRYDLTTEQGREEFKDWLWNHQGDPDFQSGGVACLGVAITDSKTGVIPNTYRNKQIGVAGKQYIMTWGPQYDHSVTIVGYDDRIQFDLNMDGRYGDPKQDELGAWIVCNSWGDGYANGGFVYCPYKYSYSVGRDEMPMTPYCWIVRKDYEPKRVLRIEMDYSHRGDIQLMAGVSSKAGATKPEMSTVISCFNFDGNPKQSTPAPEIPMLGRWADGKLHTEPMEFGFDVTDLTTQVDDAHELTYFLQVNTAKGAVGKGKVYRLSLIDYETGETVTEGLEYGVETVDIQGAGKTTYVTVSVPGRGTFRPESPKFTKSSLTFAWQAPQPAAYPLKEYVVYQADKELCTVPADQTTYVIDAEAQGYLQVAARYEGAEGQTLESRRTEPISPVLTNFGTSADLDCELDGRYLALIRDKVQNAKLASLDLEDATIIESNYAYMDGRLTSDYVVGTDLFNGFNKLRSIKLPLNTQKIEGQAFANCGSLTKIEIPDGVTSIGGDAFAYCAALNTVTIGSNVSTMSQGVFYSSNVRTVYAKGMTPPSLSAYFLTSNPVIHVYSDALEAYQNSRWAEYGTLVGDLENYIPRTETGVNSVLKPVDNDGSTYTLDGIRRREAPKTGLYIRDGLKFWIR